MGSKEKAFAIIVLCGVIGIVFAIVLQLLYDQQIFIDEYITDTMTLREFQFIICIVWEIFGIGVAALES